MIQPDILGRLPKRVRRCPQIRVVTAIAKQAGGLEETIDTRRVRVSAKDPPGNGRQPKRQSLHDRRQQARQPRTVVIAQTGCVVVSLGRRQASDQRMAYVLDTLLE